ncbi:MAG: heat-inducible transcriptional repressor HrcA [Candidatus Subteraquimicrobiales bacterium]|nr:heat-inducible transcriptional repressor HrcA [Candidatus Subteraquimicrobiales bacterium]
MLASMLDERKKLILYMTVHEYVLTGEPIGSHSLLERYQLGVSSATVRNEFASLEEMGYLKQPHTSAGRVPTEKGYRFYVDSLVETRGLSLAEKNTIERFYANLNFELDELMQKTSILLSQLTNYAGIVFAPVVEKSLLKHIDLVRISFNQVLIVLITNTGWVVKKTLELSEGVDSFKLHYLEKVLNERLTNLTLEVVASESFGLSGWVALNDNLMRNIIEGIVSLIEEERNKEFYQYGLADLLYQLGAGNVSRPWILLESLEERHTFSDFIKGILKENRVVVKIGSENRYLKIKDCSLVVSGYLVSEKNSGAVGILGPTRMNYERAISTVSLVANHLDSLFKSIRPS